MANGFVTKKNGAYYVVLRIQVEDKRKEKWISVRKELGLDRPAKLAEANKLLRQKLEQVGELNTVAIYDPSVKEYLEGWLEGKRLKVRESTYELYESLLHNHVYPDNISLVKMTRVTPYVMQGFVDRLITSGKSTNRIKAILKVLSQAFKQAAKLGLITKNPAYSLELPRYTKPEKKIWDDVTMSKFLKIIQGHPLELFFNLAIVTGMRRGEILGLTWQDVNWEKSELVIRNQLSPRRVLIPPKTENSIRRVKITASTIEDLRQHHKRQLELLMLLGTRNPLQLVFLNSLGKPEFPRNVLRRFQNICEKNNLPMTNIHNLRHLHVSWLLAQGVDFKTIQERVGHSDIATTLNIYAHLADENKAKAAEVAAEKMNSLKR